MQGRPARSPETLDTWTLQIERGPRDLVERSTVHRGHSDIRFIRSVDSLVFH